MQNNKCVGNRSCWKILEVAAPDAAAAAFAAYLQLKKKFDIGANVMGVTAWLYDVMNGQDGKFWKLERNGSE